MRSLTLFEHGVLRALPSDAEAPEEGGAWERFVDRAWFERLRRFDEARGDDGVFDWRRDSAKARQFVGVIQLGGISLEILPKVERDGTDDVAAVRSNLLWFLSLAGDVPSRARDLALLRARRAPLLDALTALFARRLLDELVQGVSRTYVALEENLRRYKGRLLMARHVARNAVHRERFYCQYDDFSEDTPLNRVLRCACAVLLQRTHVPDAQDALARSLEVLDGVTPLTPEIARTTAARVLLDRGTQRFAPLLDFARMVLDGRSPEAIAGQTGTFSLLFDMNMVFEGFVAGFLAREVIGEFPGWRVIAQAAGHTRHLYGSEQYRPLLLLEPDVLFEGPNGRLVVLDTKWKVFSYERGRKKGPRREDLYQMHAYGTAFGADCVVLHPRSGGAGDTRSWHTMPGKDRRVWYGTADLTRDFSQREAQEALKEELRALLCPVIAASLMRPDPSALVMAS